MLIELDVTIDGAGVGHIEIDQDEFPKLLFGLMEAISAILIKTPPQIEAIAEAKGWATPELWVPR